MALLQKADDEFDHNTFLKVFNQFRHFFREETARSFAQTWPESNNVTIKYDKGSSKIERVKDDSAGEKHNGEERDGSNNNEDD